MKLSLELNDSSSNVVQAYEPGAIQINSSRYSQTFLVTPTIVNVDDWNLSSANELTESHFDSLADIGAEIVVIGTGSSQVFLHPKLWAHLSSRGIGVEFMDTAAACRTYNIIMAEGRNIAALLFPIDK